MSNTNKLTSERAAEIGRVGGRRKVKKGFAWLKENDPERFKELTAKGGKAKRTKQV